jgi:hypothetical protein
MFRAGAAVHIISNIAEFVNCVRIISLFENSSRRTCKANYDQTRQLNFVLWNLINVRPQYGISLRLVFWGEISLISHSHSCKIFNSLFCYVWNIIHSKCRYRHQVVLVNRHLLFLSNEHNSLIVRVLIYSTKYFCQLLKSCGFAIIRCLCFIIIYFFKLSTSLSESYVSTSTWSLNSYIFVIIYFSVKQYVSI